MVSLASVPDTQTLAKSLNVLWTVTHTRYEQVEVVEVEEIDSMVAFLPLSDTNDAKFFILEEIKLGVLPGIPVADEPEQ